MEITLEKIELVKDRTGVSYKEAKEALEQAEGSVVDAIIALEEGAEVKRPQKVNEYVQNTMAKIKEFVAKGNISKITVKHNDDTILNIPLSVGIVGAVVAPWGLIAGAIAAFGFRCKVELTTDEGKVIDLSDKADTFAMNAREKGEVVIDGVKEKAPEMLEKAKEFGLETWEKAKDKAPEVWDKAKDFGEDAFDKAKDFSGDAFEKAKDFGGEAFEKAKDFGEGAWDKAQEAFDKVQVKRAEKAADGIEIEFEMAEGEIEDELREK